MEDLMCFTTASFHAGWRRIVYSELLGFPFKDPSHMSPGRLMLAMQLEQKKKKWGVRNDSFVILQ